MTDLLDIKTGLLEALRHTGRETEGQSTEALCAILSCDKTMINDAVNDLRHLDYRIDETQGRWRLVHAPDIPFPWEFPGRQNRLHYFPQITSTMDEARRLANRGCVDQTVVIAGTQTRGRGRMDRTWASDEGGLYFTIILKPRAHPAEAIKFNFLASLTLVEVLREECRIDARVKWPNDIMIGAGKLSGMLSEMDAASETINFINIGIGVNVNNDPSLVEPRAVSIRSLTGRTFSRTNILRLFLNQLEIDLSGRPEFSAVLARWKNFAGSLNRQVTVVTLKETLQGFAEDVDEQGALVLRLADGTRRAVCYGDCFLG